MKQINLSIVGELKITDIVTNQIIVETQNEIHYENLSLALAQSLGRKRVNGVYVGPIEKMVFGNGGATVNGVGVVTYLTKNTIGANATLYNQTYEKIVDQNNPANPDASRNYMTVSHVNGNIFSDLVIYCTLEFGEPTNQAVLDNQTSLSDQYVFNEIGLMNYDGKLLTHAIFSPVAKASNRAYQLSYTIRHQMF